MMNRRDAVAGILALGVAPWAAFAQQPNKVWRIGMLETTDIASNSANLSSFRQGLLGLGYVEGRNYAIEYRSADGRMDRFPALAAELVGLKVDVIVARGTAAIQAVQKSTTSIPIVTPATAVPLLFAASLGRPGGNVTGLTAINNELVGKRIQLLMEIVPGLARIGSMANQGNPANVQAWKDLERAAQSVNVQTVRFDVRKREDLEPAFERAVKQRVGACFIGMDTLTQANGRLSSSSRPGIACRRCTNRGSVPLSAV